MPKSDEVNFSLNIPSTPTLPTSTIAIDMMGGDHGLSVTLSAVLQAALLYPQVKFLLVGDQAKIEARLKKSRHGIAIRHYEILHTSEVIAMDESPSNALRRKRNSSMGLAIQTVADNQAHAVVSAGNTGALMALSRFILRTMSGIDRPAIIGCLPTQFADKFVHVLDLGANVDNTPQHLVEFALMGALYAEIVSGIQRPKVALLNVGTEIIKGNEVVKVAHALLQDHPKLNYIGFVEGDDIFNAKADVVVCDGFVGNVLLKSCEGIAKMFTRVIKNEFMRSWHSKLLGLLLKPIFKKTMSQLDPARYNGACFIGLNGVVIKSHGGATIMGFQNAIVNAIRQCEKNVPEKITHITELLK